MKRGLALAMVGVLLLAGCIGSDDDATTTGEDDLETASDDAQDEQARQEQAREEANMTTVTLYNESALHVGAGAPHPAGDGGLVEPVGPTTTDSFEVGPEVENVGYELLLGGGTGQARVEVYDPNGTLVFGSTQFNCAGAPGASWICIGGGEDAGETTASGTYEVRYYVAGAVEVGLVVEGEAPASASANAASDA